MLVVLALLPVVALATPSCVIVHLYGQKSELPNAEMMGEYEAQAQTHDGKPVYKYGPYFMFYDKKQWSWNVGNEVGSMSSVGLTNHAGAADPSQIQSSSWYVISDGKKSKSDIIGTKCAGLCLFLLPNHSRPT